MTREEAISAMRYRYKVTHEYFTPEEYLHMQNGIVKCEQDYHYGIATMHRNDFMATGWSIRE